MNLTKRELKILKLFCYTNKQIAQYLHIEISTVKEHTHNILKKLKEPSKVRALVKSLKMGLVNIFDIKTSLVDVGFWDSKGNYIIEMKEVIGEKE